ncbi:MAG TPA: prolyl oligopeptidase family serine peptidase [Nocardioidaceae bacterium]|nr:prolyl oligopeptidase family serine peptidase [Nocardioidaceae bacterium]
MSRARTAAHAGMVFTAALLVGAVLAALDDTARGAETAGAPADLPDGAPPAARAAEPPLPGADGWPFSDTHFPRTSGTGRLHGGASYWTDFLYDDHGPASLAGISRPRVGFIPPQGVYTYPDGPAHGNGADVFRTAVGVDDAASYWRVDWTTLADPDVPIAAWTFDRDADAATGVAQWPAGAAVTSPGIDTGLVVSSRGAWLVDLAGGGWVDVVASGGRLSVDRAAQSFVVRVPRDLLPVAGRWTVRMAAGLADAQGRGFAAPHTSPGVPSAPGTTRVYNVTFRGVRQEPPVFTDGMTDALVALFQELAATTPPFDRWGADGAGRVVTGNFWMDDHQADKLFAGDVSAFSRTVDWSRLRARAGTREPRPRGYSNRWYVTDLALGHGVTGDDSPAGDLRPNFLGRIQPYALYVPHDVPAGEPMPLTWVLHSLGLNHNQYGGLNPALLRRLCERRNSVCATTLGRGPDGWYFDEAEADYWHVWRELAEVFVLPPRQTVISGYSMGGYAAYKLGLQHPDLYAAAVSLAGPPACGSGARSADGAPTYAHERCNEDGATGALVGNARWLPYRIGHGTLDQLVPFVAVEEHVQRFDQQGLRYRFVRYPAEDHAAFAGQDRFDAVIEGLRRPRAPRNPGRVDFSWYPNLDRPAMGLRATGAYWVKGVRARDRAPGALAEIRARSFGRPDREHTVARTGPTPVVDPLVAAVSTLRWRLGERPGPRPLLTLDLRNVARTAVDMRRAGLECGKVRVDSDGPATVRLDNLPGGAQTVSVGAGATRMRVPCP